MTTPTREPVVTTPAGSRTTRIAIDGCCCQGGITRGLQDAGLYVIGIDIDPQPRYCGDEFHQADILEYLRENIAWIRANVTLISISPPCQGYSDCQRIQGREHPKLIAQLRELLNEIGVPWVIENVEGARSELVNPVTLCGGMFGLKTYRHRLFETGGWTLTPPEHPEHRELTVKMGRPLQPGDYYHAVGNFSNVGYVRSDMGVGWMNRDGIRESVPPAYATYIGRQFLAELERRAAA